MSNEKTKHTAGPWMVQRRPPGFSSDMITAKAAPGPVAPVAWVAKIGAREANAALIAAAPELLAALKEIAALHPHSDEAILARRAIAKAEGKS